MSKTIAIFGFGPGLGMGTARVFGREGFRVAVVGRRPDKAELHVKDLRAEGIEAAAFPTDVTDAAQVRDTVSAIRARFGEIDVAVHGAAGNIGDRIPSTLDLDVAGLSVPMALKLHSPILMTRALAPAMIARGEGRCCSPPAPHRARPGRTCPISVWPWRPSTATCSSSRRS